MRVRTTTCGAHLVSPTRVHGRRREPCRKGVEDRSVQSDDEIPEASIVLAVFLAFGRLHCMCFPRCSDSRVNGLLRSIVIHTRGTPHATSGMGRAKPSSGASLSSRAVHERGAPRRDAHSSLADPSAWTPRRMGVGSKSV